MLKIKHTETQSETALSVYFGGGALEIAQLAEYLRERLLGVIEIIPCSASLFIEFHVLKTNSDQLIKAIRQHLLSFEVKEGGELNRETLELPIYYHSEVAPDLIELAKQKKLSIEDVIQIHSEASYTVTSLGFAPGFAYLSGMDTRLAAPRLSSPKTVAKGSLGIADQQTAVYPNQSPGGWVIIGNCPLTLFDIDADPITPFKVGTIVRFKPITREEFLAIGGEL